MEDGAAQTGQMEETSVQGSINWKVVISSRRAKMLWIVLVGLMIGIAPEKAVALAEVIGNLL
tara:strand:- start:456 stop:641 length:186 start_codon:yes stop_codon:yes gene_type:complete